MKKENKIIAIIRIKGLVGIDKKIEETLYRFRLRRKYACSLIENNKENIAKLKKLQSFVAYGEVDEKLIDKLIEKRGQKVDKNKKINQLQGLKKQDFEKANLKPFFRLHPPRGGIKSKLPYPKGVLGKHEDISKLLERML